MIGVSGQMSSVHWAKRGVLAFALKKRIVKFKFLAFDYNALKLGGEVDEVIKIRGSKSREEGSWEKGTFRRRIRIQSGRGGHCPVG